jgi:hypothetical protein
MLARRKPRSRQLVTQRRSRLPVLSGLPPQTAFPVHKVNRLLPRVHFELAAAIMGILPNLSSSVSGPTRRLTPGVKQPPFFDEKDLARVEVAEAAEVSIGNGQSLHAAVRDQ